MRTNIVTRQRPAALLKAAAALTLAVASLAASVPAFAAPDAPTPLTARYGQQKLAWHKCFGDQPPEGLPPGAERLECSTMKAPLNWADPRSNQQIEIAVSRLRPATGQPRGTIFMNPGGPGAPGVTFPLLMLSRPEVINAYEVVGFDVRGTGESTNITCGGMGTSANDPRDRSRTNLDIGWDSTDVLVRNCAYRSGPLLKYITTEQTVRDLDLLRAVLGWQKISWVGYSGGTWMGAWYATLFPNRVDRFVLDSNTEFTATWQASFQWQPLGFERRFREDFTAWAAKYDDRFHLGTSAEAVRAFYEKLRADLNKDPLNLGLSVDGLLIDNIIVQSMYTKTVFQPLAELLRDLREIADSRGAGANLSPAGLAVLSRATKARPGLRPVDFADSPSASFLAIICQDTPWNRSRGFWEKESARQGRQYPLIGWSLTPNPCAVWPRPNIAVPKVTGRGVPPVLMVQSTHDPATPYEGAVRAHQAFAGSRLLTVTNEGDHGVYIGSNPCVDSLVDKFLLTGALPAKDTECAGTGIPAPVDPPAAQARAAQPGGNPLLLNERYTEIARSALR